jgi:hypothetical protein
MLFLPLITQLIVTTSKALCISPALSLSQKTYISVSAPRRRLREVWSICPQVSVVGHPKYHRDGGLLTSFRYRSVYSLRSKALNVSALRLFSILDVRDTILLRATSAGGKSGTPLLSFTEI